MPSQIPSDSPSNRSSPTTSAQKLLNLAEYITPAYTRDPNVEAVLIAGSVAVGRADRYSDLEIDVFYRQPPSDNDRLEAIGRAGGELIELFPYENQEWSEVYTVYETKIELSGFLAATVDQWLSDVVDGYDTSVDKQALIAAVQSGIPVKGKETIEHWRTRAAVYPDRLAEEMVREHLVFERFGQVAHMLAYRDDLLMLHDVLCEAQRNVLGILLGLNRLYLAHPHYKWMEALTKEMTLAPADLLARLKAVFGDEPTQAVRVMRGLIEEVFTLVEENMPALDISDQKRGLYAARGS